MDDLALLHRYTLQGSETAFTTVVRRYVDLVHSAALRQVRSPDLAADVTQRVFLELSTSIAKLRPDTHLAAWLFVVTRRTAIDTVRREASRQRREQAAVEASAMSAPERLWADLRPQLDEALATLAEPDRQVILLRFFEERSLAEIGRALGASENAAQKRLTRALDRLHALLAKRGVTATAAGLATELSAHAVQSAPAMLSGQIATALLGPVAALPPALFSGASATATLAQKSLAVLATAAVVTGLVYQAYLIHDLKARRPLLTSAVAELDRQIENASSPLPSAIPPARSTAVLASDPTLDDRLRALLERVVKLKQRLEQHPEQKIPELRFLTTADWIKTAQRHAKLEPDADFLRSLSDLRTHAKHVFGSLLHEALLAFIKANGGRLPTAVAQLAPYFADPVDPAFFVRYEVKTTGWAKDLDQYSIIIAEKDSVAIDPDKDNMARITMNGVGMGSVEREPMVRIDGQSVPRSQLPPPTEEWLAIERDIAAAHDAYRLAHGRPPANGEELRPYLKDPATLALPPNEISFSYAFSNSIDVIDPRALSNRGAMFNATLLFQADHHGADPATAEEFAPYFQDPLDAAKVLLAAKHAREAGWIVPRR